MVKAASVKHKLLWVTLHVAILNCIAGYPAEAGNNNSSLPLEESKTSGVTHRKRSAPGDYSTIKLTSFDTPNDTAGENLSPPDTVNQVSDFNRSSNVDNTASTSTTKSDHVSTLYRLNFTDYTDSGSTLNGNEKLNGEETMVTVESHRIISTIVRNPQIFGKFTNTTMKNQSLLIPDKEDELSRNSPARLTLMDFNGPAIVDGLENEYRTNFDHVRVKRGSGDSPDFLHKSVHEKDFGTKEPLRRDMAVRSIGNNGIDHEISVPISYRKADNEKRSADAGLDVKSAKGYGDGTGYLESFSKFGNPLESGRTSLNGRSKLRERRSVAVSGGRTTRKGGPGRKGKHRKKPKKKQKKVRKKPEKRSNKGGTSGLVADGLQVESHVEKRDSGEARSESDVRKREVRGEDASRFERDEVSSNEGGKVSNRTLNLCRLGGGEEAKYYNEVREFDEAERETRESRSPRSVEKIRKEKATRSLEEIKELVDKLIGKVGELETNLQIGEGGQKRRSWVDDVGLQGNLTTTESRSLDEAEDSKNFHKIRDALRSKLNVRALSGAREKTSGEIRIRERRRSTGTHGRSEGVEKGRDKRNSRRKWDSWTDWSSCSVTCGKGRQIRWRHCVHECTTAETEMEEKSCQLPSCGPGKFLGIF